MAALGASVAAYCARMVAAWGWPTWGGLRSDSGATAAYARARRALASGADRETLAGALGAVLELATEGRVATWLAGEAVSPPLPLELLERLKQSVLVCRRAPSSATVRALAVALERVGADASLVLRTPHRLVGVAVVREAARPELRPTTAAALVTLAGEVALAIENGELRRELGRMMAESARAGQLATLGVLTAGIAHELRNPLVALRSYAQLLPERWDDGEFRREFSAVVVDEVDRVATLLTEVLASARPATGSTARPRSLDEIVTATLPLLRAHARAREIELRFAAQPGMLHVAGDGARVRQVILNLVLNAIDATPRGGAVDLCCRRSPERDAGAVVFEVHDSGGGIDPMHLRRLFEPFFTTRPGGNGLGLTITREIVRELGGAIGVESQPGAGATFVVTLPAAPDSGPLDAAP